MIDDIVEMVLKEARLRDGVDLVSRIYSVTMDIDIEITKVLSVLRDEERRKKEDESKDLL